ncbi:MAG: hypothetical protein AAF694_27205 [Bacteroidota bacterium]
MKRSLFFLLVIAIGFSACKSGKKAYQQGDYREAVYKALNRLKSSPDNDKAAGILQSAYPALVSYMEDQISQENLTRSPLKHEKIMDMYESLNAVYDEIQRTPSARNLIPDARSYRRQAENAKAQAIEVRYALGLEEMETGYREDAIEAHRNFERVMELDPNYKDVEEKMGEALAMATLWVEVPEIPMHSIRYKVSANFFESQVQEFLRSASISPYVRFLGPEVRGGRAPKPDHRLEMRFEDFVVGQVYQREIQAERVKDSVVIGTVKVRDTTLNRYGSVKGTLMGFEKEISSTGILSVAIVDTRTKAILTRQEFPGSFIWYDYWGYVEGDKRALNDDDLKYIDKKRPAPEPDSQTLFVEFTRPIFDQVTGFLDEYYERY